ncbi:hypothetical protein [Kitasatospora sp. NPDC056181]|uniref:hypothetical protein n=1 Tax=Kitasatospora sp. NPDC056181 TaxID=3345737 RepID=UPI0035DDF0C5
MIKRVAVGMAAATLCALGAGAAVANATQDSTARPTAHQTSVSPDHHRAPAAPAAQDMPARGAVNAWINHEEHRVLAGDPHRNALPNTAAWEYRPTGHPVTTAGWLDKPREYDM